MMAPTRWSENASFLLGAQGPIRHVSVVVFFSWSVMTIQGSLSWAGFVRLCRPDDAVTACFSRSVISSISSSCRLGGRLLPSDTARLFEESQGGTPKPSQYCFSVGDHLGFRLARHQHQPDGASRSWGCPLKSMSTALRESLSWNAD